MAVDAVAMVVAEAGVITTAAVEAMGVAVMEEAITVAVTGVVVIGAAPGLMLIMHGAHPTTLTTVDGVQILA